jgi:predicted Rossmann fold flavoprotein
MHTDILIVGGGASGLAAAVSAKTARPGLAVCVAEKLSRTGKKLLATGNGRCNLMNLESAPARYLGDAGFIAPALEAYIQKYKDFWAGLGLALTEEEEGRVYPATNQASSVLDVLRLALAEKGVAEMCGCEVRSVRPAKDGFLISSSTGEIKARRVILATGGLAGKGLGENDSFRTLLGPLGHRFTDILPGLVCLKTHKEQVKGLKGIRLKGSFSLLDGDRELARETGECLFQEDGVSGIAAMQLSLFAASLLKAGRTPVLKLSPLPGDARCILQKRQSAFPGRSCGELLTGEVNRMIALAALRRAGISPALCAKDLSASQLSRLAEELSAWRIPVTGTGGMAQAQVMLGGARTDGFDAGTMGSRLAPGLYACGEMLDVAGPCGGFNLEWAWASGMLAGRKAAESL